MLISGVDIARPSPSARTRPAGDAVAAAGGAGSALDGDTQEALRRFAKFIKRDPPKRANAGGASAAARYRAGWGREQESSDLGQILDIRV